MTLHYLFWGWRVGFCLRDWHLGLTTFDDAWMFCFGPMAIYHEREPRE